jgi:IS30 family transposase
VERKSKLTRLHKVERKTAGAIMQASLAQLSSMVERVHTITSDNGREFAAHEQIAHTLSAKFYFAHPYSSWERGLNENTNGLVRQYFPKKHDFTIITEAEVARVVERLNTRPRKTLGFRTPHEVFFKQHPVALQT